MSESPSTPASSAARPVSARVAATAGGPPGRLKLTTCTDTFIAAPRARGWPAGPGSWLVVAADDCRSRRVPEEGEQVVGVAAQRRQRGPRRRVQHRDRDDPARQTPGPDDPAADEDERPEQAVDGDEP